MAVTRLLPEYYSQRGARNEVLKHTLHGLALRFITRHNDTWLRDVLRTPHSRAAGEAFAALGHAISAENAGDMAHGGELARSAIQLFRSAGSQSGRLRAELGVLYSLQSLTRFRECVAAGKPLLRSLQPYKYSAVAIQARLEDGACAKWEGNFERSSKDYREALRAAKLSSYPVFLMRGLGFNAYRLASVGNIAGALRENATGLKLFWTGAYPPICAQQFYANLSLLVKETELVHTGVAVSREDEAFTVLVGRYGFQAGALYLLAMAEISAGFYGAATVHLQQAIRRSSLLRTPEERQAFFLYSEMELASLEASLGQVNKPLERLQQIQAQVADRDAFLQLRFAAELGRLRLRRGEYDRAKKLLAGALELGERARTHTPGTERSLWTHTMADIYRALVECEINTGAAPSESWALWSRYRAALLDQGPVSDLNTTLAPGNTIVSFISLPSGLGVWLATNHGFEFRQVGVPVAVIREAAGRFVRLCGTEGSSEETLRAYAGQLSRWLLGDWDKQLGGKDSLVIEPDDPVSALPWAALVRSNGHFWSEDFTLRIRVGASRSGEPDVPLNAVQDVLAVGAPAAGSELGLPPLPDSREEVERVSSLFPRSTKFMGQAATLNQVISRLSNAEIFHFAGHGFGTEGGGLLLAGSTDASALLSAKDIQGLRLPRCRLVVLSGCSTGAGERDGMGNPENLVRAFLRAGAGEVVASYWNLNSAGTSAFMREFYQALVRTGTSPAQSLRLAAAACRDHGLFTHPYYWAGLQVFSSN